LLNVYGTIIGVFWGKDNRFKSDFEYQISDFKKLKGNICIAGDLNITLSGYTYPSHAARDRLNKIFSELSVNCLTASIASNVSQIVISENFINKRKIIIETWNEDMGNKFYDDFFDKRMNN
jgi:hypothetical protein